ncbi:MAG: hypothetical protein K0R43_4095 [Pseudoduganella sp.]|jgi:uncharacterized protein (DUF697 family)|nr:hypothetical protein [Pseudoduganella sp.]
MKDDWTVMPTSEADIDAVRERCRRLVRRRAAVSAGVAAVPIPGVDVLSDFRLFTQLIDEVNREFGLSPAQIERMQPKLKLVAYEAVIGLGGMLVGKVVTRELVAGILKRSAGKIAAKQAGKLVPIAGQIASATIGFFAFRQIGYQHVDACAKVARQVIATVDVR